MSERSHRDSGSTRTNSASVVFFPQAFFRFHRSWFPNAANVRGSVRNPVGTFRCRIRIWESSLAILISLNMFTCYVKSVFCLMPCVRRTVLRLQDCRRLAFRLSPFGTQPFCVLSFLSPKLTYERNHRQRIREKSSRQFPVPNPDLRILFGWIFLSPKLTSERNHRQRIGEKSSRQFPVPNPDLIGSENPLW